MQSSLRKFFEPVSVAVIGASSTPHKPGNDVIVNILANGYAGKVYLVNPKGGMILGKRVYASVADLPEAPDLAVVVLPARANPQAIRDCASRGIGAVILAAGGFAEVDDEGRSLQEEIAGAIRDTGVRVLGPNTSGNISTPHGFTSSFFPLGRVPRGGISYLAQTGNFATHTMRYIMSGESFGVARVVGLGNNIDVDESEVLEYYGEDPETKAVFVYLESFRRPRRFLDVARRVTRRKPVILLKGGITEDGARAALAHTAALASDARITRAALAQAGVVSIRKYSHLVLAAKALDAMPLPRGNRVGFLAPSGAMLVCLTDLCRSGLTLTVPDLEEGSLRRLQDLSPSFVRIRNPVDVWPSAAVHGVEYAYRECMRTLLMDPNVDAVVSLLMLTDETGVPPLDFLVGLCAEFPEKPVYVAPTGQKKHMEAAKSFLDPRGIPTFLTIEEPFEVLDILARCREAVSRP